jgi:hypothetical protein
MKTAYTLLSNASATGAWVPWPGGRGDFRAEAGAFSGGSVTLQCKAPNGTAIAVSTATTLSTNGRATFELGAGEIRAAVTTATGVYAQVLRIADAGY